MDVVFIRTRLQAKIARELIDSQIISKKFILVINYWKKEDEDSGFVQDTYKNLASLAVKEYSFIEEGGLFRNFALVSYLSFLTVFQKGTFYLATINLYVFSLVAMFNPFLKIKTFDDGAANLNTNSIYFNNKPLEDDGSIRRRLMNFLFPKGASYYLRQRSREHFTIFKGGRNILDASYTTFIETKWDQELSLRDKMIVSKIPNGSVKILLGSVFKEWPFNIEYFIENKYKNTFHLIILHPRDSSEVTKLKNAFFFESSAESILSELALQNDIKSIEVFHFASTVALTEFKSHKITFHDLAREVKEFEDLIDYPRENILTFIDTFPHLNTALLIRKSFSKLNIQFITNNKEIFSRLDPNNDYFLNSRRKIINFSLKRSHKFDALMAARVDDQYFQIIYKLMNVPKLYTFDEGLFTIQDNSIYNAQSKITKENGMRAFLLHKLIGLPIPSRFFYKNNDKHFTAFSEENIKNSIIDQKKIIFLPKKTTESNIKKIFIGQPWHFMYFSNRAIMQMASYINNLFPEIYLIHPREDDQLIDRYINPAISRIITKSSSEQFINRLCKNSDINVFTVASTLVMGLHESVKINIIKSNLHDHRIRYGQDNLINALASENINFVEFDISSF